MVIEIPMIKAVTVGVVIGSLLVLLRLAIIYKLFSQFVPGP